MIKTILVDYGGVLGSDAPVLSFDAETSEKTGLSQKEILDIYWAFWNDMKVGKADLVDYNKEIIKRAQLPISLKELNVLHYKKIALNREMMEYMMSLKSHGYTLIILSNESKQGLDEKIQKFKLHQVFEKIYNSAYLGMAKPNKKIFEYVLRDYHIEASTTVFIDDLDKNINAAKELGFQTVLFENFEQMKKEITTLLNNL